MIDLRRRRHRREFFRRGEALTLYSLFKWTHSSVGGLIYDLKGAPPTTAFDRLADLFGRIEIVSEPLSRLDDLIRECEDEKSLVTLLWFRAFHL